MGDDKLTDAFGKVVNELRIFALPLLRSLARSEQLDQQWEAGNGWYLGEIGAVGRTTWNESTEQDGYIEQHCADRLPSTTGQDATGRHWSLMELARPEGQSSNSLLEALINLNIRLSSVRSFASRARSVIAHALGKQH